MRVVINQSSYLPWKGYFDLIHDADLFMFLDDVQYTHRDWRSRNRIKTRDGLLWLSVPVGNATDRLINGVPLPAGDWAMRHWDSIRHAYAACPHFRNFSDPIKDQLVNGSARTLSALNQSLITMISRDLLGIRHTRFVDSATLDVSATKQERIIALLKKVGATTYISGPAAKAYIDPDRFRSEKIELQWKDYSGYPEYNQPHPPFEHTVSVLDLLFSEGPSAPRYIWEWRTPSP